MSNFDTIINTIDAATDGADQNLCPQELFMIAMGKLLTVGAFYPANHTRSLDVGAKVKIAMGKLDQLHGPLCITTRTNGLQIQGKNIDCSLAAVGQWHDILEQLAIAEVNIDPDISSTNLHHLATGLHSLKLEADSALGFVSPDFGNLPPGVSITPRQFGRKTGSEETAQKIIQTVEDVLAKLSDRHSPSEENQEYRELMEVFFASVVERLERETKNFNVQSSNSHRPLDEVLLLGSQALESALMSLDESQGELTQLPQLFDNIELALSHSTDEKTMQMMVDVLQQTVADFEKESQQQKIPWVADTAEYNLSIEQLQSEIVTLSSTEEPYTNLQDDSDSEYLAISLEILLSDFSKEAFQRTTRYLSEVLSGRMNKKDFSTLIDGAINILRTASLEDIDRGLPYLIYPIHRSNPEREANFWLELNRSDDQKIRIALWPHMAIHLLTNSLNQSQTNPLLYWVSSLDNIEMTKQLPRLESMREFHFKKFNKNLFRKAPLSLHPFFGVLMDSNSANELGPLIHEVIAKHSKQNLAKILMAALGKYEPGKKDLYKLLLAESHSPNPSAELKNKAAGTLHEIFASLTGEKIQEPWVAPAIAAYASLAGAQARPLLEKVISEKRMKLFPLWPSNCRNSAKKALTHLYSAADNQTGGQE